MFMVSDYRLLLVVMLNHPPCHADLVFCHADHPPCHAELVSASVVVRYQIPKQVRDDGWCDRDDGRCVRDDIEGVQNDMST